MKTYTPLYKRDCSGKIRIWFIEQDGPKYRTVSGLLESKNLVTSKWTVATSKNIGRSNMTTPQGQADLEVDSKYAKKLAEGGYVAKQKDVDNAPSYVEPMLATTYKGQKVDFPCTVQPKLDGIRCIVKLVDGEITLSTRRGKPITSCPHISVALEQTFKGNPELILDGELYNHTLKDNFQRLVSLVRRQRVTAEDLVETSELQYHVYDVVLESPYDQRSNYLLSNLLVNDSVKLVTGLKCSDESELELIHGKYMSSGYEGSMLRLSPVGSTYDLGKRSKNLLKNKTFDTDEFTITNVIEGEGNRSGMAGKFEFFSGEAGEFRSGIRGNFELFTEYLANKEKYIGCEATVRYFGLTDEGKPRFPVTIDVHDGARND